ncbi:HAD family hydrolase [Hydrogenimonas sp.]|uniref:HAD family hydrolase n=1 Tax=Hydrogenimonas sp. TaxID=2231112 RepID=UPI00261C75F9|nr:HAD family hydrolase [Hydrogenimonas sp.]
MKRDGTVILFDLDGTLIDSTEAILESFSAAYGELGDEAPDADAIVRMIGIPLGEMFIRLGADVSSVERYVGAYKKHYRKISREKTVLLPGAREAVEEAAYFARLGVVTTKTGRYSIELMEYFGLMNHFEVLVGSEDVENHKPHPEPILKALDTMGASTSCAWMIGDTLMDVHAAHAAGIMPYALTCGYGSEQELKAECKHLAPDAKTAVMDIRSESLL